MSKSEYSSYQQNEKFINALKTVFSEKEAQEELKKKVSFSRTLTKKQSPGFFKADTLKKSNSYSKMGRTSGLGDFNSFFSDFKRYYAEQGFVDYSDGVQGAKIIRVMETRISDDGEGGIHKIRSQNQEKMRL